MLSFLTTIKNEFLSYFVPEKMEYRITGECKKCGKCCRYMYSFDTYTTTDFKIMQFLFPSYRRFYIRGKSQIFFIWWRGNWDGENRLQLYSRSQRKPPALRKEYFGHTYGTFEFQSYAYLRWYWRSCRCRCGNCFFSKQSPYRY